MSIKSRLDKLSAYHKSKGGGVVVFFEDLQQSGADGERVFTRRGDPGRLYTEAEVDQYESEHNEQVIKVLYEHPGAHGERKR